MRKLNFVPSPLMSDDLVDEPFVLVRLSDIIECVHVPLWE